MTEPLPPAGPEPGADGFRERTDLSWNRSGLAIVAAAAVLLRRLWPLQGTRQVAAVLCICAGAACWALAMVWGRRRSGQADLRRPLSLRRARAMTASTLAFAAAGFAFAFLPPA